MGEFFEIAYASATNRLCFLTGTGLSKAITNNTAPSWQGLLEDLCDLLPNSSEIKEALFPSDGNRLLSLEEAAQVVSIQLQQIDKRVHEEAANIVRQIRLDGDNSEIREFLSTRAYRVVTTNYDKLVEELAGKDECHTLTPGLPIPKSFTRVKVYHVHGSIDSPENMVVTSEDYFKFINSESYFSRKLSTILHEDTVVILGYSLGDTDLKAIINDYRGFSRTHVIGSNIFLVSRTVVDQHVKDYYAYCYGIRVLDDMDIPTFFGYLNESIAEADGCAERSITNIKKVIDKGFSFTDSHLKVENSFFEIVSSLGAEGLSIDDKRVVAVLGKIIETKTRLTHDSNAWEQYEHLAYWLIHLASILELEGTSIEDIYLKAALRSMNTMRKERYVGYSWHAYSAWNSRWSGIIASNRAIIRKYIEANTIWSDALAVVQRA